MNITFLKLGGSLITDKKKPYTLRPQIIKQTISEISEILVENKDTHLVLGNGAGSFAHQSAAKFGTANGFNDKIGLLGTSIVHHDAMKLNQILIEECLEQKLPVFSVQPSAIVSSANKIPSYANFEIVEKLLKSDFIPFLYGTVIFDEKIGSTIFSTDTIFKLLAIYLQKQGNNIQIIQAGDYDGVLDKNNKLIAKITPENFENISSSIMISDSVDVTGGMKHKVHELLQLAKTGIQSRIINGKIKGNIKKALLANSGGTLITTD